VRDIQSDRAYPCTAAASTLLPLQVLPVQLNDEVYSPQPVRVAGLEFALLASSDCRGVASSRHRGIGSGGVDRSQALLGDGGFAAQLEGAFKNLVVALSAARCSVAEVVKLTIYLVGYSYEKADIIRETVVRHFGNRPLPACSLIGVEALARPEFQVEVEALAIAEGCVDA